jgi:hypothetical protein
MNTNAIAHNTQAAVLEGTRTRHHLQQGRKCVQQRGRWSRPADTGLRDGRGKCEHVSTHRSLSLNVSKLLTIMQAATPHHKHVQPFTLTPLNLPLPLSLPLQVICHKHPVSPPPPEAPPSHTHTHTAEMYLLVVN